MSNVHIKHGDTIFGFHKLLYENLCHLKRANRNDWDFKILISGDGMTRTGKSTIAAQIAYILDPKVTLDNFLFRGDQLIKHSLNIGKNRAVVYDEAKEGLDSKKAMNSYSQTITDYFSECGWMNQYLIIVLPEFFDLNKTVALNQSICLINCYVNKDLQRGYFGFYNRKDKRYLFIKGKKYNNYQCQSPTFLGTFTKYFPFDPVEYEKRKKENQRALKNEEKKSNTRKKDRYIPAFAKLAKYLMDDLNIPIRIISDECGLPTSTIHDGIKKLSGSK